ncbi:MAG: SOS response-associated peptidase [Actinobacteria bacterium]|nr:SOS response-associated peptidase [Actinomycetota bacterium]
MCGRFSQYSPVADLVAGFDVDETVTDDGRPWRPRWNIAPTQDALVIASSADGTIRKAGPMRWGLVPRWADDIRIGNRMINARTDKVATSNAYRAALAKRRCIVPVDGFYEWAKPTVAAAGAGRTSKTPFNIHRADHAPLALAGLWETFSDAHDHLLRTFTILTCEANAPTARIHDRMPVILAASDFDRWLEPTPLGDDERARMFTPAPDDLLAYDEVSTLVNKPSNDSPELIEPVERHTRP